MPAAQIPGDRTRIDCGHESFAITPSDDADLPFPSRGVWVGTGGHIKGSLVGDPPDHAGVVYKNIANGTPLPYEFRKIWSTGTTATDLVGGQ